MSPFNCNVVIKNLGHFITCFSITTLGFFFFVWCYPSIHFIKLIFRYKSFVHVLKWMKQSCQQFQLCTFNTMVVNSIIIFDTWLVTYFKRLPKKKFQIIIIEMFQEN
jgi:hypothetical protein